VDFGGIGGHSLREWLTALAHYFVSNFRKNPCVNIPPPEQDINGGDAFDKNSFGPKGSEGIFIGYRGDHYAIRLFNASGRPSLVHSADVKFNEGKMGDILDKIKKVSNSSAINPDYYQQPATGSTDSGGVYNNRMIGREETTYQSVHPRQNQLNHR
jgi:hypothetical protein